MALDGVKIPPNWFKTLESIKNNYVIVFHKLSPLRTDYTRYIEKQLVMTNGK